MLTGYAAVFYNADDPGTEFISDGVTERVMPGAFDRSLAEGDDIRALAHHDASLVLGRVSAGTLELQVDSVGLRYTVALPETSAARDLAASISRGDIDGSSFGFAVREGGQQVTAMGDGNYLRNLTDLELIEVSAVAFPAYESASSALVARSQQDAGQLLSEVKAAWGAQQRAERMAKLDAEQSADVD